MVNETRPQSRLGNCGRARDQPCIRISAYWSTGTSSTRRFCARPADVELVATKWVLPKPCGMSWLDGIPLSSRYAVTESARRCDSFRLYLTVPIASQYPLT